MDGSNNESRYQKKEKVNNTGTEITTRNTKLILNILLLNGENIISLEDKLLRLYLKVVLFTNHDKNFCTLLQKDLENKVNLHIE